MEAASIFFPPTGLTGFKIPSKIDHIGLPPAGSPASPPGPQSADHGRPSWDSVLFPGTARSALRRRRSPSPASGTPSGLQFEFQCLRGTPSRRKRLPPAGPPAPHLPPQSPGAGNLQNPETIRKNPWTRALPSPGGTSPGQRRAKKKDGSKAWANRRSFSRSNRSGSLQMA